VREFQVHGVPASGALVTIVLNRVGLAGAHQLPCTFLSCRVRAEALPIQSRYLRTTDVVVKLAVHKVSLAYVPHSSRKGISGRFTVARGAKAKGSMLPKSKTFQPVAILRRGHGARIYFNASLYSFRMPVRKNGWAASYSARSIRFWAGARSTPISTKPFGT
jgi:hypothetical protein